MRQRLARQLRDEFQHARVVNRVRHVLAPGERPVARHQNRRMMHRIKFQFLERLHDDFARVRLVIIFDFRRLQLARARHVAIPIIRLRRAVAGNPRCACAHAVANRLCVCTTPPIFGNARYNTRCVAVSELGLSLPSTTLPVGERHARPCACGFMPRIRHAAGLDDHQAARAVNRRWRCPTFR